MSACLAPRIIELQCPHKAFFQQDGGGGVPVGQKLGLSSRWLSAFNQNNFRAC